MPFPTLLLALLAALAAAGAGCGAATTSTAQRPPTATPASPARQPVLLPSPHPASSMSVDEALAQRRSVRDFSASALTTAELGQLLWAAQGVTDPSGKRTAPSAGALYPLEVYAVTHDGAFHYDPVRHALVPLDAADLRARLAQAAGGQNAVADAPVTLVVTGVPARTQARYGDERGLRYTVLEAGHAAENVLVEAVALGLGAVPIGAFDDEAVRGVLGLPGGSLPLELVPVGHPA